MIVILNSLLAVITALTLVPPNYLGSLLYMSEVVRFLKKNNMIMLAAAVVIGVALQNLVHSFVNDIVSPPINAYAGEFMNGEWKLTKSTGLLTNATTDITIRYGKFLSACLQLILVLVVAYYFAKYSSTAVSKLA